MSIMRLNGIVQNHLRNCAVAREGMIIAVRIGQRDGEIVDTFERAFERLARWQE